ncbi:MAG: glycosyltransferase family 1 protein, partial [Chloroflexota bacterium]
HPSDWPESPYIETRVIPWPRLWTHMRLATELIRQPPDVLFVPSHVLPIYCPVPAVVTIHDLGYYHYPEAHRAFDRWYLDWTTRRHGRVAQQVIADSLATKEDLIAAYQTDAARINVVYLGRDETLTRVTDPHLIAMTKTRYQIDGDYLLYVGTLHPRKNLTRLVEAYHRALQSQQSASVKLVIAGKRGWLYNDIFERIQQLGLTEQVIFPGYITDQDKTALLSGALGYVFPSLYEGFGLPVLEAMACGVPVLTSNTSSLPEVAGEAALLVDPHNIEEIADALGQLMIDSEVRQQLVNQGYQQLQAFSWAKAAEQILTVLERVANQP